MLTIYIDFKEAAAFLAVEPTLSLAKRFDLDLVWRAYLCQDRDLPDRGADPAVVRSHEQARARAIRSTHQRYATLRGIDLRFPAECHNTDLALGALAQLSGGALPFVRQAFAAYWSEHLDLSRRDVVERLLDRSGDRGRVDLDAAPAALAAAQAEAEALGVVDAPAYAIDGQLFIGRQHLPWIGEIAGRLRAQT
ncbi:MAG: DsbA family protein [Pseudomonadota bacterium]